MEKNIKEISKAFNAIIDEDYTDEDIRLIFEHKDEIYTQENTVDCVDTLSRGRNGYDIFSRLAKIDRKRIIEEDFGYFVEGKLIDILNITAMECGTKHFPAELVADGTGAVFIECRDLCCKNGDLYRVIRNCYVTKETITAEDVEEVKESGKDLHLPVLDLETGEKTTLIYKNEYLSFDDDECELDYDYGYEIQPRRRTVANK